MTSETRACLRRGLDTSPGPAERCRVPAFMRWLTVVAMAVNLAPAGTAAGLPAQRQVPGAFRSRVILVPVDVRVLDRDGNPVTDLTQDDFTVLEGGVRQEVSHFSSRGYVAEAPDAGSVLTLRQGPGLEASPATYRTFLIVLGRGRLQGPAKGLRGLEEFLRERLLPQDRVGVVAYNRATDLTTDREAIIGLLRRYEEKHERIEALLDHWFMGLQLVYGSVDNPPKIEHLIGELFDGPGLPALRQLANMGVPDDRHFADERLRVLNSLDFNDDIRGFVYTTEARQDLERLHAAVEYLRFLEGEKHLIFLSEAGLKKVGAANVDRLADAAADARVAMSAIHTGGLDAGFKRMGPGMVYLGPSWVRRYATMDSRYLAERTGGLAADYQFASRALDKVDRATRFGYLIGYYPTNQDWDGEFRRIEVRVRRPGVRVLYRDGYYGRDELVPYDRRAFLSHSRVSAAAGYRLPLTDVPVSASATKLSDERDAWRIQVEMTIDPTAIAFTEEDGRHVASVDVAVFVGDRRRNQVGELRETVDLRFTPETFARFREPNPQITYSAVLDLTGSPRYVKVVAYDYASDRLGSAVIEVR